MEIQVNTEPLQLVSRIAQKKREQCRSFIIRLASALSGFFLLLPIPTQAQPQIRDVAIEGTEVTFEYDSANSGQLYGVEVSNDLTTWVIFTERTPTDDGLVSFSVDLLVLGESISHFFRLVPLDSSGNPLHSVREMPNN